MNAKQTYPIGTPGQPWGQTEHAQWRALQTRQRSYHTDVVKRIDSLREDFDVVEYGCLADGNSSDAYPLLAVKTRAWHDHLPCALVTGGVHGYETSGVHGALHFLEHHAATYQGRINLLVAPCISPWAYEHVLRWNSHAIDPNRAFHDNSPAQESAALMRLVAPLRDHVLLHIDLHETTDSDESEFRPALAARDGKPFEPGEIPDGFYLVADAQNPQLDFQRAVLAAVSRVTHIAPADDKSEIIGVPEVTPGVILYAYKQLGLCAGITNACYTTTTEVYPDSARQISVLTHKQRQSLLRWVTR